MAVDTSSPQTIADALDRVGYLADEGLATAAFLALQLERPLFCEGEPGVGKTSLALALAQELGGELVRLQCYEGIDSTQALYDWDFPRQLLHLRAAEASGITDPAATEASLYDRRFLLARPVLRALETSTAEHRSVLLVDEIDRADDEFEAFLLEVLSDFAVTIPELGTVRAQVPPVVIITSNRTRDVHDALKRRCLYHWMDHPGREREIAILRRRVPGLSEALAAQVADAVARLRGLGLLKPPGVAESLDWARCLQALGAVDLTPELATASLGAVAKYREDLEAITAHGVANLVPG
ncbi:AAA family ATPase [Oryzihumus leptocrescens]|uniref:MoxR-like ATPase n=1 Tax=Oryzihumus leptocrescens TaxID=297536 RepID=A0A542Z7A4_9MICO|nr:MoxR family ATPase [Oryzihumus leptocrescens]TQL56225.1 MoxR-like ATPase [Oryzihumus leptocrescens]